jgi:hypothetical protein
VPRNEKVNKKKNNDVHIIKKTILYQKQKKNIELKKKVSLNGRFRSNQVTGNERQLDINSN